MSRFLTDSVQPAGAALIEFYREEFVKHHRCLLRQRDCFSDHAVHDVECALLRIISQIDRLSAKADADRVVAQLLKEFDVVTGLSAWSDPHHVH